jgi:hypothetical protein
MPDFINGTELNLALEQTIGNAENFLWLINPQIQLHDRIKDELKKKKDATGLNIVVVFGNHDTDTTKTISDDDIAFLKTFPSVKICYNKTLHAKFYANELGCLITSLDLHQFAVHNHIETGVYAATKGMLGKLATDLVQKITNDTDFAEKALAYFEGIISSSQLLFNKVANFDNGILGFNKKYTGSNIVVDELATFFAATIIQANVVTVATPIVEITTTVTATPPKEEPVKQSFGTYVQPPAAPKQELGFCIRTGIAIPFNSANPFSPEAYKSWTEYSDWDFPENYCHTTGKPSYGRTTMRQPSL